MAKLTRQGSSVGGKAIRTSVADEAKADVESLAKAIGTVPASWDKEGHPEIKTRDCYRDGETMKEQANAVGQSRATISVLTKLEKKGVIGSETSADFLTQGQNVNPYGADQLGVKVLAGFRLKVFALITFQCIITLGLSAAVARFPSIEEQKLLDWTVAKDKKTMAIEAGLVSSVWVASLAALGVTSYYRRQWPINFLCLGVFTVTCSIAVGLLCGRNVFWGLSLVTFGIASTGVICCIPTKGKIIEVKAVTIFISVFGAVLAVAYWSQYPDWVPFGYVVILIAFNTFALVWMGSQIDHLSSRLSIDEYMLPLVYLWAELLPTLFLAVMMMMGSEGSQGGVLCDACCEDSGSWYKAGPYCHCDWYVYEDGTHAKDKWRPHTKDQDSEATKVTEAENSTAPPQNEMGSGQEAGQTSV